MSESLERWGDAAPEWMRDAATVYGREGPSELELDRMLTKVQAAAAMQSAGSAPRRQLRLGLAGKLALALAVLALVLLRAPSDPERSQPVQRLRVQGHGPHEGTALPAPQLPVTTGTESARAAEPPARPAASLVSEPRLRRRDQARVAPVDELTLLARARRVLARDPERAYALTEQHREYYRRGALSEERELLAIEALMALEQGAAAEARAAQFARRFPRSVHARKLGMILQRARP